MITVNPANPGNIIATWKQDVGPALQSRSDLIASSLDGGRTWKRRTIRGLTKCTGGTADAASDPWLSAGGDGTVYFSGLAADLSTDPPTTAVVASHSSNGGRRWSAAATVAAPLQGNEHDAITGSPMLAGHAYLAFANFLAAALPRTNTLEFSRTTDGGATWSPPVLIDQPGPFQIDFAPRILVLPDGTLLTIFGRADLEVGLGQLYATRSLDEGRTWLPPVLAGSKPIRPPSFDPETGDELPQPNFPSAAVAPDGSVYVAFEDSTSPTSGAIGVARSRDGGRTWTSAPLPGVTAFAFEPAIAVDEHGTVGVTWYDLRNDRPGDAALTADVWFAHSQDHGTSWRQTHVAGPTDLRTAPLPTHGFVGEYQGLAGLRRGFAAIFTLAAPQAKNGPTDIFFARIGPGR
jgi:Neuraminidase (sialidase)